MAGKTVKLGLRCGQDVLVSQEQDLFRCEGLVETAQVLRIASIGKKTLGAGMARMQVAGNVAVNRSAPQKHHVIGIGAGDRVAQLEDKANLREMPANAPGSEIVIGGRSPFAGARVADLSPSLAQRLRLPGNTKGVAIVDVDGNSPAAGIGFQPRDIVREVNGVEISSAETLNKVASDDTRWWRFTVERDGRMIRQMLRY